MFNTVKTLFVGLLNDRRGVTAMEYGMIAAATIVAITVGVSNIKTSLSTIFTSINTAL